MYCQVVELTADLAEENTTATQASEMLESESAERMRLEKELKDTQVCEVVTFHNCFTFHSDNSLLK